MSQLYRRLLQSVPSSPENVEGHIQELKWSLFSNPCPKEYRGLVWKVLLNLHHVSASCYISLVHRGPSALDDKIRSDTFRTMTTDASFLEHVSEDMLIRVLNAFVWISKESTKTGDTSEELQLRAALKHDACVSELTYVQGMNVLAAPFLMVLPEMEAFFAFSDFVWRVCPLYVHPTLKGVHCGIKLVDMSLRVLDPELYGYMMGKGLSANMYAFPSVLTFSACTPPLSELLRLWDVMFAFGFHLNILFIVAQLALIRDNIMASSSPAKLLRKLPPLEADMIIKLAGASCKKLPRDLYTQLVRHLHDENVVDALVQVGSTAFDGAGNNRPSETLPAFMQEARNFSMDSIRRKRPARGGGC
ncbi:rab-GTPase-TBC domain-domain-containing protein [Syncephalastrum racemosum]|uniref:Rab-GTPase-TBC domain-domain-containing protein n=1 Tax=Syncephalastrum racemosum TaxID=13706 RepID=A0A1X2GZR1_SYNRA|nr:rab-GTPase-TBC domain-domain-containing protein [Syncephalastrum racemosum]